MMNHGSFSLDNFQVMDHRYIKIWKVDSWEVDSWRPQDVLRTFPGGPSKHQHLDVPKFFLNFLLEFIRLTKSI